ncbi:Pentatricopeptide repeat-containing protein At2g29760, chloroplastic [Linum perenne]
MMKLTPLLSPSHHLALMQTCRTHEEVRQIHGLSVKANTFCHPSVSARLLSLYADEKINDLRYAESVLRRVKPATLVMYNLAIKSYVENQRSNDAIALFSELVSEEELWPDCFTFPCVIKACARLGAVKEGEQIHGLSLKLGFGLDMFVQSSLVSLYSKCGVFANAKKVFDKMGERDFVAANSLVDGYLKCGQVELAMQVFEEITEKDVYSWNILIDGLCKCGKVDLARKMFDEMPQRNVVTWNSMISGYMNSGDFEAACQLFREVPERNLISWNAMIHGCDSNKRFSEALKVFVNMLEEGFLPNNVTMVSSISSVTGLASLSKAKWFHSYIVKRGFKIDNVLATSLIDMYSKVGSIESAQKLFESVRKRRKLGHWTAIIVGLGMHGLADIAIQLFHEMHRIKMKPNGITFVGLLNACSHAGLVDHGRKFFNMMTSDYGIEPSVEHYGCLVDMLCRAGHLEEAKKTVQNMDLRPNKVIWMSLLSGSKIYGNIDIAEFAAYRLMEVAPNTIACYIILSNIYATAGRWNDVSKVREMMKERGFRKEPGSSLVEHKGELHKFIVGDKSHPQAKEIYLKLKEMREKLGVEGYVPDTTQVLLCIEDDEEKKAELENHSERLATAFGLINIESHSPIRIMKNLRVCNDCHSVTKLLSQIYRREIIVRDSSRFHHFKDGACSCKDFW